MKRESNAQSSWVVVERIGIDEPELPSPSAPCLLVEKNEGTGEVSACIQIPVKDAVRCPEDLQYLLRCYGLDSSFSFRASDDGERRAFRACMKVVLELERLFNSKID